MTIEKVKENDTPFDNAEQKVWCSKVVSTVNRLVNHVNSLDHEFNECMKREQVKLMNIDRKLTEIQHKIDTTNLVHEIRKQNLIQTISLTGAILGIVWSLNRLGLF